MSGGCLHGKQCLHMQHWPRRVWGLCADNDEGVVRKVTQSISGHVPNTCHWGSSAPPAPASPSLWHTEQQPGSDGQGTAPCLLLAPGPMATTMGASTAGPSTVGLSLLGPQPWGRRGMGTSVDPAVLTREAPCSTGAVVTRDDQTEPRRVT